MCTPDLFLAVLAVLFPPIAVWIKVGVCSADSVINIALCCLGYLPGLIHAWYTILKHPEPDDEYAEGYQPIAAGRHHGRDPEGGHVTYYYVAHEPSQRQQAHPHAHRTYGTAPPFGGQQQQDYGPQGPGGAAQASTQEQSHQPGLKQASREQGQAGEGSHGRPPPTYAEAVKGDHKIQDRE